MSELIPCKSMCRHVKQQLKSLFPKQHESEELLEHNSWEMEETKALRLPFWRVGATTWQATLVVPAFFHVNKLLDDCLLGHLFPVTGTDSLIETAESWKGVILVWIFWSVAAETARPASPERLIPRIV